MKYIDEYRNAEGIRQLARRIAEVATRHWTIMEVCGGQTHAIVRYGIDDLLPTDITLVHGPGCPVCVTPVGLIDRALEISTTPDVVLCSFGDMIRVPGTTGDLRSAKATGSDIRVVYSPMDALAIAGNNPNKQIVFFAVGFETTAPTTAFAVQEASRLGLDNFSILVSHMIVPPAIEMILSTSSNCVQGFLTAGHVCTVMGTAEYEPIAKRYRVPIVATGFEPLDILYGVYLCTRQLEAGRAVVENAYARAVRRDGNPNAINAIHEVFEVTHRQWRGIGEIPFSGFGLRKKYAGFDAERRFGRAQTVHAAFESECISGSVLTGASKPHDCPAFAKRCMPERPLGAPMVSSEGTCAAYYRHRRRTKEGQLS
ncbi:MAG: hydrogenase formation protein HypD [Candidatus Latescibacterota bacterium]|nr:MAG: hydrogenase formation protein HypD [Candidatus Latescibacterota bacterium]